MPILHGQEARVYFDRYNVSTSMNDVSFTVDRPVADVSAFGNTFKTYVAGQYSWKLDAKGWLSLGGTVGGAGSVAGTAIPDGTAGVDLALAYLQGAGTAFISSETNKVVGYFPHGFGTGNMPCFAGKGGFLNTSRTGNLGGGEGVTTTFGGTAPFVPAKVLGQFSAAAAAFGTTSAMNIGTPSAQNGLYVYFWLTGKVGGAGAGSVSGTVYNVGGPLAEGTVIASYGGTAAGAYSIMATAPGGIMDTYVYAKCGGDASGTGLMTIAVGRVLV